jgi:hypothetical protein
LTGLTHYVAYTVTLTATNGSTDLFTATVQAVPDSHKVSLPIVAPGFYIPNVSIWPRAFLPIVFIGQKKPDTRQLPNAHHYYFTVLQDFRGMVRILGFNLRTRANTQKCGSSPRKFPKSLLYKSKGY